MPWNSSWPVGTISVKANRTKGQQNTTYIEDSMGNDPIGTNTDTTRDHFWNVGANEDGRHRFIQSLGFTVGGNPADPVLGAGMNTVLYPKTTNGRVEWFHRNVDGIYQFIPSVKKGTVNITSDSTYIPITNVPSNIYGIIYFFFTADKSVSASGIISSNNSIVKGWTTRVRSDSSGLDEYAIELRNKGAVDLNIYARRGDSSNSFNGKWDYVLLYWAF